MNYSQQHAQKGDQVMDAFSAINIIEGFTMSDSDKTLQAWSYVLKNGLENRLQGYYGREAQALINAGKLDKEGNIL